MTRTYKKLYNRKSDELTAKVLYKVTKRIEVKADKVGYNIDEDQEWIAVHNILIDWEFDGVSIPAEIYSLLESVCVRVGYDLWAGMVYYIERINI